MSASHCSSPGKLSYVINKLQSRWHGAPGLIPHRTDQTLPYMEATPLHLTDDGLGSPAVECCSKIKEMLGLVVYG